MKKIFFLSIICCSLTLAADDHPELAKRATGWLAGIVAKAPDGGKTGEDAAWGWAYYLGEIMQGCENWPTDTWLEPTEKILNAIADKMTAGPDGYKGFVGTYGYNEKLWCDVHVGDAILVKPMLVFAEIVHDHPALKEKYGASAKRFLEIAKRDLIEKWETRGTFHVDGPFAGYPEWNMFCHPDQLDKWFKDDHGRGEGLVVPSIPFNKSMDMGECMLRVYRLTGEETYREKAALVFNRFKAGITRIDGTCTWNYWEPVSPKDIVNLKNPNHRILAHFVDVHPKPGYPERELHSIVYAYNMGVTFTEEDMKRFVATNLRVMWNGDKENPKWVASNAQLPLYKPSEKNEWKTKEPGEGALWPALAQFDPTIHELALKQLKADNIVARTALEKLAETPPSYERKYAPQNTPQTVVKDFPWMKDIKESAGQFVALVIPSVVEAGEKTVIFSKAHTPRSEAKIWLRPLAGGERQLITTIPNMGGSEEHGGEQYAYEWDGTIDGKRTPGQYVVIWEHRDGERAYPVTLK